MRIKNIHRLLAGVMILLLGISLMPVAAAAETEEKLTGISVYGVNRAHYSSAYVTAVPQMLLDGVIGSDQNMWHLANKATSAHITFDLGDVTEVTKLNVYSRLNHYGCNIKEFDLWLSDTAPTYTDTTGGTAPTGLADTPTVKDGTMSACSASATYGTITLPEGSHGRYLTLYIKNTYDASNAIAIQEIEFYGYENENSEEEPVIMPEVKITSVTEAEGVVTVSGTTENLGQRKVEIIVNEDLNQRYVAENDEDGNFTRTFELPYNGEYTVEASVRDYSDFSKIRQTTPDENYFEMEGACTWGAAPIKHSDGLYYMVFSTWDEEKTFDRWASSSELGYAVSTKLGGPYIYQGRALDPSGCNITNDTMPDWGEGKLEIFHNPTMFRSEKDGKYYLYFMAKTMGGTQQIGVAYADTPAGPWTVSEAPVIATREGHHDDAYVCNPSVVEVKQENGEYLYYAVYRANGTDPTASSGYKRASGYATASSPLGPFTQSDELIMVNPNAEYSVEDCYVWYHNGQYYALAKDMSKGGLTGYTGGYSYALYESLDGVDWALSEHKLAFPVVIPYESGDLKVTNLERTQLYLEDTIPFMVFNSTTVDGVSPYSAAHTCNVQIPLLGVAMATDEQVIRVEDGQNKNVNKEELSDLLAIAKDAERDYYDNEAWWSLYTATRAAEIVNGRENVEQADVDFVVAELEKSLKRRNDPWFDAVNVVRGKPIVASSVYSNEAVGTFPAEQAVDGNEATRWAAKGNATGDVTLEIDLLGRYSLESFSISKLDDRIRGYTVQYQDGADWKVAFTATAGETSGEFAQKVTAEKIRLVISDYTSAPTLFELKVYGKAVSQNILLQKSVTASSYYASTEYGNYPPENAVDGDMNTRWSAKSGATGISTLEFDLGGNYYPEKFEIYQFVGEKTDPRIETYQWEYFDGSTWKTCFEGTGNDTTAELFGSFAERNVAQKLRLSMSVSDREPTLTEVKVYGSYAGGNVALNKPISVSDFDYGGNYTPNKANDGSMSTRAATNAKASGTITYEIQLQGRYALQSFKISDFKGRITGFNWEYYDGQKWQKCYENNAASGVAGGTNIVNLTGDFSGQELADRVRLNLTSYSEAPSIWEIEVNGLLVPCQGVSLNAEGIELEYGQSDRLIATLTPTNAVNQRVEWLTSDASVVTVADGVITAVGIGSAEITVITDDGGYRDTCSVTVVASKEAPVLNASNNAWFASLSAAVAAAKEGDTIRLCADLAEQSLIIDNGLTLDLNGYVLTADHVVAFNGTTLMDGSADHSGKLIVNKDNVLLDRTNGGYLPVFEENGYIFTKVKLEGRVAYADAHTFTFSPLFETFVHDALVQGAQKSGVKIAIRLSWIKQGNYKAVQDFIYVDEMVAKVIGSYDEAKANYGVMFVAGFADTEADGAESVTVSAVVLSDTGVEIASVPVI